jgi:hypothetical protein
MNRVDRLANTLLLLLAVATWVAVGFVLTSLDPRSDTGIVIAGALLLGAALALTVAPLLWIATFIRNHRIAFRGDWLRVGRRAGLVGLVVFLLVVLRAQGALSEPLAVFVIGMAVLVELTLSVRR